MENQHRKIDGYRELNKEEIDLMNEIKAKGRELVELVATVQTIEPVGSWMVTERFRWASLAKDSIETGVMQLVRAVALPA